MTTLLTVLAENFADWECAMAMAAARTYYGFESLTATPDGQIVTSAGGLKVTPDLDANAVDISNIDAVLVCGGRSWVSEDMPNITPLLKAAADKAIVIGGICAGTRALAAAGLLNNTAHTGNALEELESVIGYSGQAHFVKTPAAIRSGNVVTAPGTASFAFMTEIMDALGCDRKELDVYVGLHAAQFQKAA